MLQDQDEDVTVTIDFNTDDLGTQDWTGHEVKVWMRICK